jgi:type IV pilus assembly protein PilE
LIELMVAVAVAALLAAVALPSYSRRVMRSRVPPALDALATFHVRMEQRYQDTGNYSGGDGCGVAFPAAEHFGLSCTLTNGVQGFTATATGNGPMAGYTYTVNHLGVRATTAHPGGVPSVPCWSTKGVSCDT